MSMCPGSGIPTIAPRQNITDDPGSEEQQGKNLVDAALENGVQCFVWSTLPSSRHISGGRFVSRIYEGRFILARLKLLLRARGR